jgi:hypothetical protein
VKQDEFVPLDEKFTARSRIPAAPDLYYECLKCGSVIPSRPKDNIGCTCGNVFVDVDAFRVSIDDYSKFRVLRRTKRQG